jgi:hypothetical protein
MNMVRPPTLRRRLLSCFVWGSLLVWPAFLILAYAGFFAHSFVVRKGFNEILAPIVLGLAGLVFVARWRQERQPLMLILSVLDVALFCRELHFAGTTKGIYVALALIAVWAMLWWRNIATDLEESDTTGVLLFALMTYALSQAVARRAFRGILPLEAQSDLFRTGLEELLENVAHLSMLLVAVLGFPRWDEEEDEDIASQDAGAGAGTTDRASS